MDTSVIIAAEKQLIDFSKWQKYDSAYISSVTIAELLTGVHRAKNSQIRVKRSAFVEHIIGSIGSISFGEEEARVYAQVLDDLYKKNVTIGVHDLMIGSTAVVCGYPVLTANVKDFSRIPGVDVLELTTENKQY